MAIEYRAEVSDTEYAGSEDGHANAAPSGGPDSEAQKPQYDSRIPSRIAAAAMAMGSDDGFLGNVKSADAAASISTAPLSMRSAAETCDIRVSSDEKRRPRAQQASRQE